MRKRWFLCQIKHKPSLLSLNSNPKPNKSCLQKDVLLIIYWIIWISSFSFWRYLSGCPKKCKYLLYICRYMSCTYNHMHICLVSKQMERFLYHFKVYFSRSRFSFHSRFFAHQIQALINCKTSFNAGKIMQV